MIAEMQDDGVAERTLIVAGETPGIVLEGAKAQGKRTADSDDMEYRKAFQQFVTRGTPIELRDDENTLTTDLTKAIPTILVNRILEKLETIGNILPLVTRTSYAPGMNIPTASVKPVASWVAEGASSDTQKKAVTTAITFTHFKLRCEISMSMEASVMAISAFEEVFVKQVSEAMVKAIEGAIFKGPRDLSNNLIGPKGILDETAPDGQAIEIGASASFAYTTLTGAEGKLPLAYEGGAAWFMTKKTFMDLYSLVDNTGQPIARVNYGLAGRPERSLLGRPVILNDYMGSNAGTVTSDTVVAFLFDPSDYVLNTNYNMGIQRKQDWDTEDMKTKAVMAVDGKVIDKNSLVTITKKA